MLQMKKIILIFFLLCVVLFSQDRKELSATRIFSPPKIDGILDEDYWYDSKSAQNFLMLEPYNGKSERSTEKTEVIVLYDNEALYIGAKLFDSRSYEILKEFGPRDEKNKNADMFEIWLNPFNDGLNQFNFGVTAAGVQFDGIFNGQNLDMNWDAVWESEISYSNKGWFIEMKIPYSAIRFPNKQIQEWGLNIVRGIRRYREFYSWNFVDIEQSLRSNQDGLLTGIKNITPPIRLSLYPYTSIYYENYDEANQFYFNGGLDLKYGISENFTLDMTLIPDFGQTKSDDLILNTSPFEIRYDENRPFFTEGTDLFNKAGLFYSRRIGQVPDFETSEGDEIINLPSAIPIINATKISGRNKNNLGIGVFNAVTNKTYISLENENSIREELLQPLTNYNLIVIDQTFNQNSSLTFTNTNVKRFNKYYRNANVSSILLSLTEKKNIYNLSSKINFSQINLNESNELGFLSFIKAEKIKGKFRFQMSNYIESDRYDHNDLGYLRDNNEVVTNLGLGYYIFEPIGKIIKAEAEFEAEHKMLYKPFNYKQLELESKFHVVWKNHLFTGISTKYNFEEHDYNESRISGRVFLRPARLNSSIYTSSDYRKKFALDTRLGVKFTKENKNNKLYLRISPRVRLNDHFSFIYVYVREDEKNQFGYISNENNEIIFSKRNQLTYTNKLIFDYTLNTKMYINVILRHYWSRFENKDFYTLNNDGNLNETNSIIEDSDINFNSWNIDFSFSYQISPGSFLSLFWKNQLLSETNELEANFYNNIINTFDSPMLNSLSLKLTYYLDYNNLKLKNDRTK